jgi:sarcosine oxidase subunit alpha
MTAAMVRTGRAARPTVIIYVDGSPMTAVAGQSVGAALLEHGAATLRWSSRSAEPRGLFCAMGACYECAVRIDGRPGVRACMTLVTEGLRVDLRLPR